MEVITNVNGYVVTEDVKAAPKYKAVGNVYQTKDYSIFKGLPNNRPIDPKNVKSIVANMEKYGILALPIIVNEHFEIVDGQHRFEAVKQLGGSILFLIAKGYGDTQIQALNTVSKKWNFYDYIEFYAKKGVRSSIELYELCETFQNFPASSIFVAYVVDGSGTRLRMKTGTLEPQDYSFTHSCLTELEAISDLYPHSRQKSFLLAYVLVRKHKKNFSCKEFAKKLGQHSGRMIPYATVNQAREFIEDVYNYKKKTKVNLRY